MLARSLPVSASATVYVSPLCVAIPTKRQRPSGPGGSLTRRERVNTEHAQAEGQATRITLGYGESLWNYFRGWRYPFFGTIFLYTLMVHGARRA